MNIFRLELKTILKNKIVVFWIIIFPILLSTFLNLSISNMYNATGFDTIKFSIVDADINNYPEGFIEALEIMEFEEDKMLFDITKSNLSIAEQSLDEGNTIAYLNIVDGEMKLTIKNIGISQTILKSVLDQYIQSSSTITNIILINFDDGNMINPETLVTEYANYPDNLAELDRGNAEMNLLAVYFYAIIGMAVMYGGFLGTMMITSIQANLSPTGARVSAGPIKRFRLLFIKLGTANILHFFGVLLLIAYITLVLGIVLSSNLFLVVLIALLASITGVWLGAFMAISLRKAPIGLKIAITSSIGVIGGMFAGMMSPAIKYWVNETIPIVNLINPANLINDGLYSLYYYPTTERYFTNVYTLLGISIFLIAGTLLMFRRDSYESI